MGSVYLRGQIWWIKYYPTKGQQPTRESSESRDREEAVKLLKIREGKAASGHPAKSGNVTFSHLINDMMNNYLILKRRNFRDVGYKMSKHVLPYFGNMKASEINGSVLTGYILYRQQQKAANGTINRELAAIRRAFNIGKDNGLIEYIPKFSLLPEGRPRQGFFSEGELKTLCKYLPDYVIPIVKFGFITGWRKQEILSLEWRNVDFSAGEIRLEAGTTKNMDARIFPMTPDLRELLNSQRKKTDAIQRKKGIIVSAVFHHNGRPILSFRGAWEEACKKAKLSGRYFHDFRRTAARNWAQRVGVQVAMKLLGERTRHIFDKYAIVSKDDLNVVRETRILRRGR